MRVKYTFSSRRTRKIDPHNKHRQGYPSLAKEVIISSDIVLEVLDARFIKETRNFEMEEFAREHGKILIYILNKSDLVDHKEIESLGLVDEINPYIFMSCKRNQGRRELREIIKIQAKNLKRTRKKMEGEKHELVESHLEIHKQGIGNKKFFKIGDEVHVGIIGYPNVGKSSLINMLTGRGAARTSPKAGFTRGIQKVRLAEGIMLLDTPGVMSDEDATASQLANLKKHAMIGVRTYDSTKNPEFIVAQIMREYSGLFENHYKIDANGDSEILLEELGKRRNTLLKGGLVDMDRIARIVLKDWQSGKIKKSMHHRTLKTSTCKS
jgi:ribosome biogenesis GTPase A